MKNGNAASTPKKILKKLTTKLLTPNSYTLFTNPLYPNPYEPINHRSSIQ